MLIKWMLLLCLNILKNLPGNEKKIKVKVKINFFGMNKNVWNIHQKENSILLTVFLHSDVEEKNRKLC